MKKPSIDSTALLMSESTVREDLVISPKNDENQELDEEKTMKKYLNYQPQNIPVAIARMETEATAALSNLFGTEQLESQKNSSHFNTKQQESEQ